MNFRTLRTTILLLALLPVRGLAQWEKLPIYQDRFLDEVFFVDNDHGWISESLSDLILRTADGGVTWRESRLPGATGSKIRDFCFLDATTGFVAGSDGVWKTTDGGATWEDVSPPTITGTPAIWFISPTEGVIGSGTCDNDQASFGRTTDGGQTWEMTDYTGDFDAGVGGIRYHNGTYIGVGGNGQVWTSTDRGETWSLSNDNSGGWQEDIAISGNTIHAASADGNSCTVANGTGRIMTSTDAGLTWSTTETAPFLIWGVTALSESEAWACGDGAHIYHTTNSGRIWYRQSCGVDDDALVDDIVFTDATHGWAVGSGIYRYTGTTDVLPVSAGPDRTICVGDAVQLTATEGSIYVWEPADGLSCTDCREPIATPTTTTAYTVTVYTEDGCSGHASVTVNVLPTPTAAVAETAYSLCPGGSVQLSASGGTTYHWEPIAGLDDPDVADPIASPSTTTTYVVFVSNGSCTDVASATVTVGAPTAHIVLPDTIADPHDRGYRIPIRTLAPIEVTGCPIDSFSIVLSFNASLFFPTGASRGRITGNRVEGGKRYVRISFDRSEIGETDRLLTELIGDVLLGNQESTPLTLESISFDDMTTIPDIPAGSLRLSPICTEGDPRLLSMGDGFGVARITPNPSSGTIAVETRTVEEGAVDLEIFSTDGTRVFATAWDARAAENGTSDARRITLPNDLSSGIYRIVLRTAGRIDTETLIIAK